MDLALSLKFEGWNIRYNILKSQDPSAPTRPAKCAVFVHGTPWSSIVFKPTIEALLARGSYQILVYDLAGYGQSQEFDTSSSTTSSENEFQGDTSVKFQARALTELLKQVQMDGRGGHPAPAVIAHDIAGTIVLRAHLLHDCKFDTMMLVDANCVLPWGDGFYKLARSEPQTFLKLPPSIFEAVARAVTCSAVHEPKVLQTGWEDALTHPWLGADGQRNFVRQVAQANDGDVAEMLDANLYGRVGCDVKVVWGEQDQWIPREKIEDLIRKVGGRLKEKAFIPAAGHLVMLDQPGRFTIEVFDWLTRFGSERSHAVS
ncbi:Alpha/Beta hydrolase protein [Rhexocercosporidium sp. MPI-PUGE-AT-0058]|nr:Alpha/Beta hydrolase protein [Rhexocercosporidium sp. MPI-PUGE-AT-0058]